MLIFEGPDGAGKTSLIKQFQDLYGVPIAPRVVTKDTEAMTDLREWVDQNLDQGFQYQLFDRHRLISEPIYGPILRGDKPEPGFADLVWMGPRLRRLYQIKPIIVYCLPPLATVRENLAWDPDNTAVVQRITSIYSSYVAKAAMDLELSPGTVHIWDYTRSPRVKGTPGFFPSIHTELKERSNGQQ